MCSLSKGETHQRIWLNILQWMFLIVFSCSVSAFETLYGVPSSYPQSMHGIMPHESFMQPFMSSEQYSGSSLEALIDQSESGYLWVLMGKVKKTIQGLFDAEGTAKTVHKTVDQPVHKIVKIEISDPFIHHHFDLLYRCANQNALVIKRISDNPLPADHFAPDPWPAIYDGMQQEGYERLELIPDQELQILTLKLFRDGDEEVESNRLGLQTIHPSIPDADLLCSIDSADEELQQPLFSLLSDQISHQISVLWHQNVNGSEFTVPGILACSGGDGQSCYHASEFRETAKQAVTHGRSRVNHRSGGSTVSGSDDDENKDPSEPRNLCPKCLQPMSPHAVHECPSQDHLHAAGLAKNDMDSIDGGGSADDQGIASAGSVNRADDINHIIHCLASFSEFPQGTHLDPYLLAEGGWFYTGEGGVIHCSSCNERVDINTLPLYREPAHAPQCRMINGGGNNSNNMTAAPEPGRTSGSDPLAGGPPRALRDASGHQLTGREVLQLSDVARSLPAEERSVNGYENSYADPDDEPPPILDRITLAPSVATSSRRVQSALSLADMFPCPNPIHPDMRREADRLMTFQAPGSSWPWDTNHRINQFARAGFYHIRSPQLDGVCCWYCGGGLAGWKPKEEPWTEHARWFPLCEYVLQQRGEAFVLNEVQHFSPPRARPRLQHPAPEEYTVRLRTALGMMGGHRAETNLQDELSAAPEQPQTIEQQVDSIMQSNEIALALRGFGFDEKCIKKAIERQLREGGEMFTTYEGLTTAALSAEAEWTDQDEVNGVLQVPVEKSEAMEVDDPIEPGEAEPSTSMAELEKMERDKLCKQCEKAKSCHLILPCGHRVLCKECADVIKKCPLCKRRIQATLKFFAS